MMNKVGFKGEALQQWMANSHMARAIGPFVDRAIYPSIVMQIATMHVYTYGQVDFDIEYPNRWSLQNLHYSYVYFNTSSVE